MFEEENNPSSGNMIFAIVEIARRICIIIILTGEEHNANQMKSGVSIMSSKAFKDKVQINYNNL